MGTYSAKKNKKNINADKNCHVCKGYGIKKVVQIGEYWEEFIEIPCNCINKKGGLS